MTARHPLWRVLALFAALSMVAAACGDDDETATTDTTAAEDESEAESESESEPEEISLAGFKGTTPLVELDDEFKARLDAIDPDLGGTYNYGAETYDAFIVITLAAIAAGTDGIEYANEINEVTRNGEKCTDLVACKALAEAGTDFDYDGVSGPMDFSGNGEPTIGSYGVQTFGDDNRIDDTATEYVVAEAPAEFDVPQEPTTGTRAGDGILKFGTLLPETGNLAFLGPPEIAGAQLAVEEINAAGGFNGAPVELVTGDSGDTSTDIANQTVDRLLAENVDAIIGAASSSVSLTVIDKITSAGVVQFSPANTDTQLSTYDDKGLYFRNAPSDFLQGNVLGEIIAGDGNATVALLVLDDSYGTSLADVLEESLTASGSEIVARVVYDPAATTFDAEVQEAAAEDPDAIVVIGFEESSRVLTTMIEEGVGPQDVAVYGVDGNTGNALGEDFEAGE
ncbi:MAG: ABC transporter substrate-binding protein [Actinomycetota bacterium]|nr:ABC transporter substrate-binding protein [Actinomycetota bacterium]